MSTFQKTLVIAGIVLLAGALVWLSASGMLRELAVVLSSAYGAAMILFRKIGGFFSGSSTTVRELEDEHREVQRLQQDLIATLMHDRQVYREKMTELGRQRQEIGARIAAQEAVVADYADFETWEENVWSPMSAEEQQAKIHEVLGPEVNSDEYDAPDI